ncbi:MAG TPA: hypothetical protein VFW62_03635, partial [bacterium]|nr:hypothetical protein [bacterium]
LLFLYAIGFLLIAVWDNRPGIRLGAWPRALALAVVALVGLGLFAFFYLTWSPLEASTILGLQGRYFIPIVPALALVFYWNRGEGRRLPALDSLVPWLSALVLGVAGFVLLVRYYPL